LEFRPVLVRRQLGLTFIAGLNEFASDFAVIGRLSAFYGHSSAPEYTFEIYRIEMARMPSVPAL
jgi:hypothetical protein